MTGLETLALRPATADDFEFWRGVHRACFKTYIEHTWGVWDEADQLERLRRNFDPAQDKIILLAGRPIGRLCVEDHDTCIFLASIAILPEYQNRGIGARLVQQVIATAEARQVPVRLHVLKVNPARALYERLGFRVTGGDEHRHDMERPSSGASVRCATMDE